MKVIIAGSRKITSQSIVAKAIDLSSFHITEVVSGTAFGVDKAGEEWARSHNLPVKQFPADWETLGRKAGYVRNVQMAEYADGLIAVWDGISRGTKHMIETMKKTGKPVYVHCGAAGQLFTNGDDGYVVMWKGILR